MRGGDQPVPTFSHSKMSTYQQCPQKYKFRYLDEIPPPIRSIELHLGDSVHKALERLYQDLASSAMLSCQQFLAFYQEKWDESYTPEMRIVRSETTAGDYMERGRQMLQKYYQTFYPFNQSMTLELET